MLQLRVTLVPLITHLLALCALDGAAPAVKAPQRRKAAASASAAGGAGAAGSKAPVGDHDEDQTPHADVASRVLAQLAHVRGRFARAAPPNLPLCARADGGQVARLSTSSLASQCARARWRDAARADTTVRAFVFSDGAWLLARRGRSACLVGK